MHITATVLTPGALPPIHKGYFLLKRQKNLSVRLVEMPGQSDWTVPDELILQNDLFQQEIQAFEEACSKGLAFDGPVWVPGQVFHDTKHVWIACARSRYGWSNAVGRCYAKGLFRENWQQQSTWPLHSMGVDTGVITHEGEVLVGRRSPRAGKWPAAWFVGFGEGIQPGDQGDMRQSAWRCLKEELGLLDIDEDSVGAALQLEALGVEARYLGLTGLAIADFRGAGLRYGSRSLCALKNQAHDGWESEGLQALTLPALRIFLSHQAVVPSTELFLDLLEDVLGRPPGLRSVPTASYP